MLARKAARGARRSRIALVLGALLALSLAVGAPTAHAELATQAQIETDLTCQCGCGLTVHSCNHLNCGSGIPLKKEIAEQIATGKSREEILSYFENKYGEKILSAPTTRGFNIAAWTVPFIAIALGGLIIGLVLVRWRRGTSAATDTSSTAEARTSQTDPELRARLERELAELDRRL